MNLNEILHKFAVTFQILAIFRQHLMIISIYANTPISNTNVCILINYINSIFTYDNEAKKLLRLKNLLKCSINFLEHYNLGWSIRMLF